MTNEVKILIEAVDKASATMKKVSGEFDGIKAAVVGTTAVVAGLTAAYMVVNKVLEETVGVMVDYAEEVRDMSRITGMTADETSRLIQVADDLKVEYGTLKQAARLMAQDGLVPNISTLADLSDKYLAIQDPMARAEWAAKNLGRSYQEMTKILEAGGDAIREMAQNQPEGLVLSEEDLQSARDYEIAMDQLNDTFLAMKVTIGKVLTPALVDLLELLNNLILTVDYLSTTKFELPGLLGKTQTTDDLETFKKFISEEEKVFLGLQEVTLAENNQEAMASYVKGMMEQWAALVNLKDAVEGLDGQERLYHDTLLDQVALYQEATPTYEEYTRQQEEVAKASEDAAKQLEAETKAAEEARRKVGEELVAAYASLEQAQRNWSEKVGEDAYKALEDAGAGAEKLAEGAAIVDDVFGLNITEREAYLTAQQEVAKAYADGTLNSDQYRQKLVELADVFEDSLAKDIQIARDQVTELQSQLDILGQTKVTTTVDVIVNYPNGQPPTGTWPQGTGGGTTGGGTTGGGTTGGGGGGGGGGGSNPNYGQNSNQLVINTYTDAAAAVAVAQAVARMKANDRITSRMGG